MEFEQLIADHGDMIWRIVLAHERNRAQADELYQEVCFSLWRARDRVAAADNARAYVARLATNQAVSHVRRALRQPVAAEIADVRSQASAPAAEDDYSRLQLRQRLLEAVRTLPLTWRIPVTLTLEGFKPKEIADVMGTSANSVSLRLSRARRALRDAMLTSTERGESNDDER